jgi:hypothetical protein
MIATHDNVSLVTPHSAVGQAMTLAVLAHQGGWDEILLVLGPIAIIIGLLMLARKRVDAANDKAKAKAKAKGTSDTTAGTTKREASAKTGGKASGKTQR